MMPQPLRAVLLLVALSLGAEEVEWSLGEKSHAVLDGDSTLRSWSVEAGTVHGSVSLPWTSDEISRFIQWIDRKPKEAETRIETVLKQDPPPVKATLKIKVEDLESGNERMERDMREALKADKHPWVVYSFKTVRGITLLRPDGAENPPSPNLILHTTGILSLAGTEKKVDLDFDLTPADGGYLLVSRKTFLMTNFGITPPTAFFGLLKAHDEVDILYRIHVVPGEPEEE